MFYLLLAILCSSTIAFLFKFAENREMNPYIITSANYFAASFISLLLILMNDLLEGLEPDQAFLEEWKHLLSQDYYLLSPYNSVLWGILIGGLAGFFFFYSFLYYQKSVKINGVGLSGTFSKLGILLPMIFSIFIWREFPTGVQWIGIILSLVSIVIVNISFESIQKFSFNKTILLLFLFGGIAEFSNKIFQQYALSEYKDVFLFAVFLSAFIISVFHVSRERIIWGTGEILTGFAVGVPNLFSSYFLILALNNLAASVVFPIFSAGSIVFINLGGLFIFKEKISAKNKLAIVLVVIALVLMNL